jgi:hypothetical protein
LWARAPATADVRRTPRRGTSSSCDLSRRTHRTRGQLQKRLSRPGKTMSFSRSSDPCTSIVTTHRRGNSFGGGAVAAVSRSGKPTQVGGTGSGVVVTGRSTARRSTTASARKRAHPSQNRKVVEAIVPARNAEFGFVPARRSKRSLQKSVGGIWPRISSAHALQKERSGSSERGPSRGERRR